MKDDDQLLHKEDFPASAKKTIIEVVHYTDEILQVETGRLFAVKGVKHGFIALGET